ncbi:uncharacterized protein LOC143920137 [Arctopsyche grandis]|uniref:uncharacterized protein LOC143920137 n=1 Tax=Arctopsyche grandis TaxID=121162 RepID=UPI00406D8B34
MFTFIGVLCILSYILFDASCEPSIGGPADLNIKSIDQCPDPEQYKYVVNIQRHKVNRTHEAFDGNSNLEIPLDENTGIYVNVAKKTKDGSYKPNELEFKETDACRFLLKWVGKGFTELLTSIGEPPNCPVKTGSYVFKNFLIDYRELPSTLPYGDFRADMYLIRDEERVICLQVFFMTKPKIGPFGS